MSTAPAEAAGHAPARKSGRPIGKIILFVLLVPLIAVIALELNTLRLQQKTERKRREIAMAGGRSEVVRQVPAWMQALAGEDFHSFFDQTAIVTVSMTGENVGDAQVAALSDLPHLTRLDLENSSISIEGLKTVSELKSLRELRLIGAKVTDISPLANLPNLEALRLDYCGRIQPEHLEALEQFPKLRVLGAAGLRLTDAGVAAIAKCTQLEELDITGATLSETGLRPLQQLKRLKLLRIAHSRYDPADLEAFQQAVPDCQVAR